MLDKLKQNRKWIVRLGVMVALLLVFFKWINLQDSLQLVKQANVFYLSIALIFVFMIHILKAIRFYFIAHQVGAPVNGMKNLAAHFVVPIIGRLTPAKLGEGFKILLVPDKKQALSFCFVLEKLADSLLLFIIALFAILQFKKFVNLYLLLGALIIIGIIVIFKLDKILKFITKKDILEEKWFGNYLKKMSIAQWVIFTTLSLGVTASILIIAVFVNTSLSQYPSPILVFQLWALAVLIGLLSALPGGFGAREIGYTALLMQFAAMSKDVAGVAATLVILVNLFGESVLALLGVLMKKLFSFDN